MKKFLLIGLIVSVVLVLVGGAGVVYARVRGLDNSTLVTEKTTLNGDQIIRQYSYSSGDINGENEDGFCPNGSQGECGLSIGPGGMMQGYGYGSGGMMGGRGNDYGPGMMGGRGNGSGPGMMGGRGFARGEGIMHDYMIAAFASAVSLTPDEVETRLSNGETLKEIAIAQGKTEADLPALWTQVRQAALDQAVAAGVITQAQADLMLEHMNNYQGSGFGPGFDGCPMMDGDETQQP